MPAATSAAWRPLLPRSVAAGTSALGFFEQLLDELDLVAGGGQQGLHLLHVRLEEINLPLELLHLGHGRRLDLTVHPAGERAPQRRIDQDGRDRNKEGYEQYRAENDFPHREDSRERRSSAPPRAPPRPGAAARTAGERTRP